MAKSDYPGYIEFFVDSIDTDTVQYKPYCPHLSPVSALVVRVEVPEEYVIDYDVADDVTVITEEGEAWIYGHRADIIEKMNKKHINQPGTFLH